MANGVDISGLDPEVQEYIRTNPEAVKRVQAQDQIPAVPEKQGFFPELFADVQGEMEQFRRRRSEALGGFRQGAVQAVKHPVLTGVGASRGILRAITDIVPEGLEKVEAGLRAPVSFAAQKAAQLFVPEEARKEFPVTLGGAFQEQLGKQRALTQRLEKTVPGTEEGAEIGVFLLSLGSSVGALSRARALKKIPKAQRAAEQVDRALTQAGQQFLSPKTRAARLAEKAAAKTEEKIDIFVPKLRAQPSVIEVIKNNPKLVENQLKQGIVEADVVVDAIKQNLTRTQEILGKAVARGDRIVRADTATKIPTDRFRAIINTGKSKLLGEPPTKTEKAAGLIIDVSGQPLARDVTVVGKRPSALSSRDLGRLSEIEKLIEAKTISPNTALLVIDKIDELLNLKNLRGVNRQISAQADRMLLDLRKAVNGKLRFKYKEFADNNDAFGTYMENAREVIVSLERSNPSQYINRVLNVRQGTDRRKLIGALDAAEKSGILDVERVSAIFMEELRAMRAAIGIREVQFRISDPAQDLVENVFKRWQKKIRSIGAAILAPVGGIAGFMGGVPSPFLGASLGFQAGGAVGGFAGLLAEERIIRGLRLADPRTMLEAAAKSRQLTVQARQLAQDAIAIRNQLGPGSDAAFLKTLSSVGVVAATKPLVELATFVAASLGPQKKVDTSKIEPIEGEIP